MRQPIVQDGTSVKHQVQGLDVQGLDVQGQGLQKVSSRPRPWPRGLHHWIATKFQRLRPCFLGPATRIDYWKYCPMSRHFVNQRWRLLTGSRKLRKSQLVYMIATTLQWLHPCFQCRATRIDYCGYCPMSGHVVNQRLNRKCEIQDGGYKTGINVISACRQVGNEILTATPIFKGSAFKQDYQQYCMIKTERWNTRWQAQNLMQWYIDLYTS